MNIILNKDLPSLGYKGDEVSVKPGYARNYLIPKGLAVIANNSNRRMNQEILKQQANKIEKVRQDAQTKANKLESTKLKIKVKSGISGKIFGTVTNLQVSHLLAEEGFEVDRRQIRFEEPVKEVGTHTAIVECYKDIYANVTMEVIGDKIVQPKKEEPKKDEEEKEEETAETTAEENSEENSEEASEDEQA